MSENEREIYNIGVRDYTIEKVWVESKKAFRWLTYVNGVQISATDSKDNARRGLHIYAVSQLRSEYYGHQERMIAANKLLGRLEGDWFYLAKFLKSSKVEEKIL